MNGAFFYLKTMKNNTISKPKYFKLTLYKDGSKNRQVVNIFKTRSQNRFSRMLKLIPNEFYALLEITYSDDGHNDGYYSTKADLMLAYEAFTEK